MNLNNDLCRDFSPVYLFSLANFYCLTQIIAAQKNTENLLLLAALNFKRAFLNYETRAFDVFFFKVNRIENRIKLSARKILKRELFIIEFY